jgi:hypothetical protein
MRGLDFGPRRTGQAPPDLAKQSGAPQVAQQLYGFREVDRGRVRRAERLGQSELCFA